MGYSVKLYDIVDPGFISLTSEKIVFNFLGYAGYEVEGSANSINYQNY